MGKLRGKVAVTTGRTQGIGFATAKLFVKEDAYVFTTGRRQKELDEAVKAIGSNVTGVEGILTNRPTWKRSIQGFGKKSGLPMFRSTFRTRRGYMKKSSEWKMTMECERQFELLVGNQNNDFL